MPIAGLDSFLKQNNALLESPLKELENATIGVDVAHFIASILAQNVDIKFESLGGFPITLSSHLDSILASLKEFNIKLVFVFSGLKPVHILESRKVPNMTKLELAQSTAWKLNKSFRGVDYQIDTRPIDTILMYLLKERDIEFQVAPYFANHQLKYLFDIGLIDAMLTSNDSLLLFNFENGNGGGKIIVGFNPPQNKFNYIDLTFMLQCFQMSFQQFRQISLFVGNLFQPYPFSNDSFQAASMNYQSVINDLKNDQKRSNFLKGLTLIRFTPVLKLDGRVEPIPMDSPKAFLEKKFTDPTAVNLPGDIYYVLGPKLPDEFFFYQSIGLKCLNIIESISSPIERLPIDLLTSPMYENLINSDLSIQIRGDLINSLTMKFNRAFQRSQINLISYLKTKPVEDKIIRTTPDNVNFIDSLIVHQNFGEKFILGHFIKNLSNDYLNDCKNREIKLLLTNYELIGTSILRSMVTYELILKNGEISEWLSPLVKFSKNNTFDIETALLIIILFKRLPNMNKSMLLTPKLKSIIVTPPTSGNISDEISIISKFATLYKSSPTGTVQFQGTISRELRHFNSTISKLQNEINESIYVHMIRLLLSNFNDYGKLSRESKIWNEISSDVPFQHITSTISGLLVQTALEQSAMGKPIDLSQFNNVLVNPQLDCENAFKFVLKIFKLIDLLAENNLINFEIVQLMKSSKSVIESIKFV